MRSMATRTGVKAVEVKAVGFETVEVQAKDERVLIFGRDERGAALSAQVLAQAGLYTLRCRDEGALYGGGAS